MFEKIKKYISNLNDEINAQLKEQEEKKKIEQQRLAEERNKELKYEIYWNKRKEFDSKYFKVYEKRCNLREKVNSLYSIGNSCDNPFNKHYIKILDICNEELKKTDYYNKINKEYKELSKIINESYNYIDFFEYKKMALIFEKQKEYRKAIAICHMAIKNGIMHDGTSGGFYARIGRINKKAKKEGIELNIDFENMDIVDENGEVIN